MILYKYYGFSAGLSALESSRLGFREPIAFNDPFELTFLDNAIGPDVEPDDLEFTINELKKSVAILSLTRTPLNPLMWAHYGENHTGFVIGYDVDTPFLMSENYNLIPVDRGDVVYTYTKTLHKLNTEFKELLHQVYLASQGMNDGSIIDKSQFENLARKIFLTKHASWVYEEEVRVVKSFLSLFETVEEQFSDPMKCWDTISQNVAPAYSMEAIHGLKLYKYKVDIKEVYMGVRNPLLLKRQQDNKGRIDSSLFEKAENEKWLLRSLKMTKGSWNLEPENGNPEVLKVSEKQRGLLNSFSISGTEALKLRDKLSKINIDHGDKIDVTNWNKELYISKNNEFQ